MRSYHVGDRTHLHHRDRAPGRQERAVGAARAVRCSHAAAAAAATRSSARRRSSRSSASACAGSGRASAAPASARRARARTRNAIALGRARVLFLSAEPARERRRPHRVAAARGRRGAGRRPREVRPRVPADGRDDRTRRPSSTARRGTTARCSSARSRRTSRLERRDGIRRHFAYDWQAVARCNPAYARYVEGERARLGETHPLFLTQYCLKPIAGGGRLFSASQRAQLARHARAPSRAGRRRDVRRRAGSRRTATDLAPRCAPLRSAVGEGRNGGS